MGHVPLPLCRGYSPPTIQRVTRDDRSCSTESPTTRLGRYQSDGATVGRMSRTVGATTRRVSYEPLPGAETGLVVSSRVKSSSPQLSTTSWSIPEDSQSPAVHK